MSCDDLRKTRWGDLAVSIAELGFKGKPSEFRLGLFFGRRGAPRAAGKISHAPPARFFFNGGSPNGDFDSQEPSLQW